MFDVFSQNYIWNKMEHFYTQIVTLNSKYKEDHLFINTEIVQYLKTKNKKDKNTFTVFHWQYANTNYEIGKYLIKEQKRNV